jgi:hypothetical protein
VEIFDRVPSNCHRLDYPGDWSGLIESVISTQNFNSPVSENLVSRLLERERAVFPAFPERGRTFDVAFEERLPSKVEPVGYGLNALRIHALPMRESCPSKLGEMGLQLGLGQPLSVEFVVAILKRHRVIPDLGRNVNRPVQVPEPFAPEKLELKGLTHRAKIVFQRTH